MHDPKLLIKPSTQFIKIIQEITLFQLNTPYKNHIDHTWIYISKDIQQEKY